MLKRAEYLSSSERVFDAVIKFLISQSIFSGNKKSTSVFGPKATTSID